MSEYDVVVIGAGPGGYVCAIRAAQLGLKTAIIDKQWLGGVCLNIGCIPSKALLKNADVAYMLREGGKEFGFSFDNLTLDYSQAVKRSRTVSDRLVKGVGFLMRKNGIDVHMGTARLTGKNTVQVSGQDGSQQEHSAKNVVVATGASVAVPPRLADRWKESGHLYGGDPANRAAQVGGDHRCRGDRGRIRHRVELLWSECNDCGNAPAAAAVGR